MSAVLSQSRFPIILSFLFSGALAATNCGSAKAMSQTPAKDPSAISIAQLDAGVPENGWPVDDEPDIRAQLLPRPAPIVHLDPRILTPTQILAFNLIGRDASAQVNTVTVDFHDLCNFVTTTRLLLNNEVVSDGSCRKLQEFTLDANLIKDVPIHLSVEIIPGKDLESLMNALEETENISYFVEVVSLKSQSFNLELENIISPLVSIDFRDSCPEFLNGYVEAEEGIPSIGVSFCTEDTSLQINRNTLFTSRFILDPNEIELLEGADALELNFKINAGTYPTEGLVYVAGRETERIEVVLDEGRLFLRIPVSLAHERVEVTMIFAYPPEYRDTFSLSWDILSIETMDLGRHGALRSQSTTHILLPEEEWEAM